MTSRLKSLLGMGLVMFAAGFAGKVEWIILTFPAMYLGATLLGNVARKAEETDIVAKELQKFLEELQRRTS